MEVYQFDWPIQPKIFLKQRWLLQFGAILFFPNAQPSSHPQWKKASSLSFSEKVNSSLGTPKCNCWCYLASAWIICFQAVIQLETFRKKPGISNKKISESFSEGLLWFIHEQGVTSPHLLWISTTHLQIIFPVLQDSSETWSYSPAQFFPSLVSSADWLRFLSIIQFTRYKTEGRARVQAGL